MAALDDDPYADLAPSADPYADLADRPVQEEPLIDTPFPEKPGTSQASIQLPEMATVGTNKFLPEGGNKQDLKSLGVTAAMLTTTDPAEIAQILQAQNPDVGISYAPDGAVLATNNANGKTAVINRPGISYMDVVQGLGLVAAYSPAGRVATGAGMLARHQARTAITDTAKKAALKKATAQSAKVMAAGAAATEGAMQEGQALAGGERNLMDVAVSGATAGILPDYVAAPLVRTGAKAVQLAKQKGVVPEIPATVTAALKYAEDTGKKIATSDALAPFLTPAMNIWLKMSERIPVTGLGGQRVMQQAQRADSLSEMAKRFNINVDTELGKDIAQGFTDRMVKQRFFGANKNPTPEMLERAWQREGADVTDTILQRYIRKGDINEEVVDKVLDSGRTTRIAEMYSKLTPDGQRAARQRFMAQALTKAEWRPEAPQLADPKAFAAYLDSPKARKAINVMFGDQDREVITGVREYLKLTQKAQETGKGAGMAAAGEKAGLTELLASIAILPGLAARAVESDLARAGFLRLAYAKGDEKAIEKAMDQLRPALLAVAKEYRQKNYDVPGANMEPITQDMVKKESQEGISELRRATTEMGSTVADLPKRALKFFGY